MRLPVVSDGPIFSLAREKIGEKRALGDAGCFLPLNLGGPQCFGLAVHSIVTSCVSDYAPPDTGVSDLQLVAVEQLPSIEGKVEIRMGVIFLRGKILFAGTKAFPYEGKVPRRKP